MMSTIRLDHHMATRDERNSILRIYFTDIADDEKIIIYQFLHLTERKEKIKISLLIG